MKGTQRYKDRFRKNRIKGGVETLEILDKWITVNSHKDKIIYNYTAGAILHNINSDENCGEIYNMFRSEIYDLSGFPPEAIAAGIGMYTIMCYLSYKVHGNILDKSSIFYICLLYIDLDYRVDHIDNPHSYIKNVKSFIEKDLEDYHEHSKLDVYNGEDKRFIWYRNIVEKNPDLIRLVYDLFTSEVKSYYIQKQSFIISEDILRKITKEKSKNTAKLICGILDITDPEIIDQVIELGYISQILDDILDLDEDKRDNIKTMVTHQIKYCGNIDKLFNELISLIDGVKGEYNELKILMIHLSLYAISKYKILSSKFMIMVEPYILIDHRYNVDLKLH